MSGTTLVILDKRFIRKIAEHEDTLVFFIDQESVIGMARSGSDTEFLLRIADDDTLSNEIAHASEKTKSAMRIEESDNG